jgi:hypothetical protein
LQHAAITAILLLVAVGQSSLVGTTVSFPAMLAGGSKGIASSLPGTLYLSEARLEFEAFPQVEYVTLPCPAIKETSFARGNKNVVTIVSADATYRFDLHAKSQSQQFMAALTSNCKNLSKNDSSARNTR